VVVIGTYHPCESFDFTIQLGAVQGGKKGVLLTGLGGTTINHHSTFFVSGATSVAGSVITNGADRISISGTGSFVSLVLGPGPSDVTIQNVTACSVVLTAIGGLHVHALNSTLAVLVTVGASAAAGNSFQAQGLNVSISTVINLGWGANDFVQINDSHFYVFVLYALGNAANVQIEAGAADGVGTQFDGPVTMVLGANAQIFISPLLSSDQTRFNSVVTIVGGIPKAILHRSSKAVFAFPPTLINVN
jgi:hypothetical protein